MALPLEGERRFGAPSFGVAWTIGVVFAFGVLAFFDDFVVGVFAFGVLAFDASVGGVFVLGVLVFDAFVVGVCALDVFGLSAWVGVVFNVVSDCSG